MDKSSKTGPPREYTHRICDAFQVKYPSDFPFPSDQIFSVRRTIAYLSQGTTLEPGSVILTGTPKGVGFVRKPPIYMKHGDRVDTWIGQGIGTLVNRVVEEGQNGAQAKL